MSHKKRFLVFFLPKVEFKVSCVHCFAYLGAWLSLTKLSVFPSALYSSAKVPLLSVQRHGKTLAQDEYTGADPETGEELFHAKNSSKFKVDFKVSFKNRARATKQEIYDAEITFRCDLVSSTMRRDGIVNKAQQASPAGVLN